MPFTACELRNPHRFEYMLIQDALNNAEPFIRQTDAGVQIQVEGTGWGHYWKCQENDMYVIRYTDEQSRVQYFPMNAPDFQKKFK